MAMSANCGLLRVPQPRACNQGHTMPCTTGDENISPSQKLKLATLWYLVSDYATLEPSSGMRSGSIGYQPPSIYTQPGPCKQLRPNKAPLQGAHPSIRHGCYKWCYSYTLYLPPLYKLDYRLLPPFTGDEIAQPPRGYPSPRHQG